MNQVVLLAIIGSGGFWAFVQYLLDKVFKKRGQTIEDINEKLDSLSNEFRQNTNLTLAISRDRLNHLCNRFLEQGYIPLDEYDSFIEIGKAYIDSGGNSSIKAKYIRCKELKVR